MKRYLIAGCLLLAAAVISVFLPSKVLEWQDEKQVGRSETRPAQPVILTGQTEMTLAEKLNLLTSDTVNTLTLANGRNYAYETIEEKAREELVRLKETGIAGELDLKELVFSNLEASFYIDMEDSERSLIIWNLSGSIGPYRIDLMLDDETGKILGISVNFLDDYVDTQSVEGAVWEIGDAEGTAAFFASEQIAPAWGTYLGLPLVQAQEQLPEDFLTAEEKEIYHSLINGLKRQGYAEEEARRMAGEQMGIPFDDGGEQERFFYLYRDEGGEAAYCIETFYGSRSFRIMAGTP